MKTQAPDMLRPEFISPAWLRHTTGFTFITPPPEDMVSERYLLSPNLWERIIAITLQAQRGDFRNVGGLIDVANLTSPKFPIKTSAKHL